MQICSIIYQQAQEILGQSNLISISLLGGSKCAKSTLFKYPIPSYPLHSNLVFISHFLIKQWPCPHIPHPDISMQFNCHLCREGGQGMKEEAHWLKNNLFKNYYTQKKKNVIPQRQAVWLTPVRGMINDSIFCLCCLLPLAAAAIYHHPLSAVESSSDSASQQTFSTRSRTTRGNYYCQNNNGLA